MSADELPPNQRRNWFAVWRWRLPFWAWGAGAMLLPAAYLLSYPIALYLVLTTDLMHGRIEPLILDAYTPAQWCLEHSRAYENIFNTEFAMLDEMLGIREQPTVRNCYRHAVP